MRSVVADTGPLQYLVLTEIDLPPRLFEAMAIPAAVQAEMLNPAARHAVRNWASAPPPWLTIPPASREGDSDLRRRGAKARAVISAGLAVLAFDPTRAPYSAG